MSTSASSRPLLVLNGSEHFFVEGDLRSEYEKLPGGRWGKDVKAHIFDGEYFTPETCPEREYSKRRECRRVTIRTRDISAVPPKLLPKLRPWIRPRDPRKWSPAVRSAQQEERRLSTEKTLITNQFFSQLSPDQRRESKTFTPEEIEMFCWICDPANDTWGPQDTQGPTTPLFKTLTLEERILQDQALRTAGDDFSYLSPRKYFADRREGMPTVAEQQKRRVDEAFDLILGERKRRRA
jgi:hypothetical protein